MKAATFAKLFDHTCIYPDATRQQVLESAETAVRLGTKNLTVQHHYMRLAGECLKGTGVLLGACVGFPHGNETPAVKEFEARVVLDLGADEIDMMMNIPALKNGEKGLFIEDIQRVVEVANGLTVKVILENCYLTDEEKRRACQWITQTGAHFVKTATGFSASGATLEDVRLMVEAVEGKCGVKAAAGIRSVEEVLAYLEAGARRIGTTRTEQFWRAYHELPAEQRAAFGPFVEDLAA